MAMSKKQFKGIAEVVKHRVDYWDSVESVSNDVRHYKLTELQVMANALADYLSTENAQFRRETFLEACGF